MPVENRNVDPGQSYVPLAIATDDAQTNVRREDPTHTRDPAGDYQAPTVTAKEPTDRTKATRRTSLLGRIVKGAAIAGVLIATAIGGLFVANTAINNKAPSPVVPIEVPVEVAPGQLPDATAPPVDQSGGTNTPDGPVRAPTLPGLGNETSPDTNQAPRVFSPIQIRQPDVRVP